MSHNGDPGAQVPHVEVQESGGEISMSIEETNRLRISLGLKPLNMEAPQKQSAVDVKKQEQARKEAEQERLAADLRARIEAHKSARQQQSFLAVKGLGEADEDDDMASWVERSRRMAEEQRQKQKQQGGGGTKKTSTSQGRDDDEDEDDGEGYGSKDLAGLKVRHVGMDDLSRGDEVVLTLADRGILDEKGNLQEDEDELENVRIAEERKRKKAREAAAPKAKPLWEEDGKRRGILDKYDEEDDQVMKLDQLNVHDADLRREETRRRLEAAGKILDSADTGGSSTALKIAGDYLTSEEQASKKGPEERKKKRKERKMRSKAADEDEEGGNTESLIAQLEAQKADREEVAGISTTGGGDLGTRGERASAKERAAAAEVAGRAEKRGRFDAALEKSNWASQALKPAVQAAAGDKKVEVVMTQHSSGEALQVSGSGQEVEAAGEDEADLELQLSLERARRAAAAAAAAVANVIKQVKHEDGGAADSAAALLTLQGMGPGSSLAGIAASSAKKREEEEARIKEELNPGSWGAVGGGAGSGRIKQEGSTGGGLLFNDSMDFVSNISLKKEDPGVDGMNTAADLHSTAGGSGGDGMDVDSVNKGAKKSGGKKLRNNKGSGGAGRWITASDEEEDEEEEEEEKEERRKQAEADAAVAAESVATQSHLGKGLSGVLSQLKDKGQLQERQVWAGRTSDKSKVALQGLDDVFTGGSHEDRIARSVEAALTRKDEFGRVKTPKERFRELCYDFHGMTPSKNQIAKRQKQAKMELSIMKDASSEREAEDASKLLKVQERASQPFLVLSGKGVKETLEAARGAKGAMLPPPNKLNNASTASKKQKSGGSSGRPPASLGGILGGGLTPLTGDKKVEAMLGVSSTRPLGV